MFLLELVGGVLKMAGENNFGFREFDSRTFALLAGFVGLVWTLPNAVILYSQRGRLTETKKPGL